ncbi:PH (Pleckstrin Homology) domain-containing protein [Litoreibacter ponti]|uniref:PH (Pleckstrin Homology) domain-containing protein n=1 Tax=Litoreibacter ponti TaxID=1510457 RepID=A0A2T6BPH6_9RHOB|nr:photosynthetic complex putative assembly protein PuhB [Litoreibacter ponti]PTX57983.1 PH (Pleckstrin Homology) domain-containing protein [Litoreibacter ponti]
MPHDDFEIEPVPGLPELPPEGEKILWQGKPDWWALAKESLNLYWVMGYFVLLGAWRSLALSEIMPVPQAIWGAVPFLIMGLLACGLLAFIAFLQAWATVYTITNRRVAMRVGAALNVTLNLPYTGIASADLDLRKRGHGTIALELMDQGQKLSYLSLWPHVRPWKMNPTQPALRCIKDAQNVATILGDAAQKQVALNTATETPMPDAVPAE